MAVGRQYLPVVHEVQDSIFSSCYLANYTFSNRIWSMISYSRNHIQFSKILVIYSNKVIKMTDCTTWHELMLLHSIWQVVMTFDIIQKKKIYQQKNCFWFFNFISVLLTFYFSMLFKYCFYMKLEDDTSTFWAYHRRVMWWPDVDIVKSQNDFAAFISYYNVHFFFFFT